MITLCISFIQVLGIDAYTNTTLPDVCYSHFLGERCEDFILDLVHLGGLFGDGLLPLGQSGSQVIELCLSILFFC